MPRVFEKLNPIVSATTALDRQALLEFFLSVRAVTTRLCDPLSAEDCNLQSMEDASPPKWHLAHTTWFFENFILLPHFKATPFHPKFGCSERRFLRDTAISHTRELSKFLSPQMPLAVCRATAC